jgi:hypothetical protein
MVEVVGDSGSARWKGGFANVLSTWEEVAPQICRETKEAMQSYGHKPNHLGKHRQHWSNMHKTVELHLLRRQLADRGRAA